MARTKRFLRVVKIVFIVVLVIALGLFLFFSVTTSVTANLDTYVYELPYKEGGKYKVVQGYGGLFSHRHIAAIDFRMPTGTPVHAAREGVVYAYKDNSDEGGPFGKYKNKANYIMIKHSDDSFGCYWHLQKNGVLVKSGPVSKGQQIGVSGATGFVLRPHLHFSVKRKLNYEMNSFVRTKFNTSAGVIILKKGESYERPTD